MNKKDQTMPLSPFDTTILVVEDEAPIRLLIWHILKGAGFRVHLATDGVDGLRKISQIGAIDLLITDLSMPGITGLELARHALEIIPTLKVIYATGSQHCFPETRADITCLIKPFTVEELLRAVDHALRGHDRAAPRSLLPHQTP